VFELFPKKIILLALLVFVLCVYPVLIVTPFFPASADSATTIALRVIEYNKGIIPETYAPFNNVNFGYQLGFVLFTKFFTDLFPILPDYLWFWLLGSIFSALQVIGLYLFSTELFKNSAIGEWSAILFIGTKLIYENLYVGEYPWVCATALMFFFFYFLLKKNPVKYFLFPAIFIIHPAIALNTLIVLFCYYLAYGFNLKEIFKLGLSLVFVIPSYFTTYHAIVYNLFSMNSEMSQISLIELFKLILIIPFGIGILPPLLIFLMFIYCKFIYKGKVSIEFSNEQLFLIVLGLFSLGLFSFFSLYGIILNGRVIELILISVVIFCASIINWFTNYFYPKHTKTIKIIIVIVSIFIFFSSSKLNHYRSGSKITMEEAKFAEEFKRFDSLPERVLFLTNNKGKMVEYSNKISFDSNSSHMISESGFLVIKNKGYLDYLKKYVLFKKIVNENCLECINELDVKYIVLDSKTYSNIDLNTFKQVFSYKQFKVYKK